MRYAITWVGTVHKTVAVDSPTDALYHVWSRYRADFKGGAVHIAVHSSGGLTVAELTFPVTVRREVEAETPADALRSFLHDDSVPELVRLEDVRVVDLRAEPSADEIVVRYDYGGQEAVGEAA